MEDIEQAINTVVVIELMMFEQQYLWNNEANGGVDFTEMVNAISGNTEHQPSASKTTTDMEFDVSSD